MRTINIQRKEQQIKVIISQIIENLDDSNIVYPTVVDVRLSNDSSHAKVFISFLKKPNKGLEQLRKATNYIKHELGLYLKWRKIPNLIFEVDHVTDDGMRIDNILNQIKKETNND